ncbi:MAG TPA: pyridoxal 5'-phosphate synthase lyase subunit PdxS [candidate division Zixibacteria bacterium]|nr:pyridoxal 5'-phosphate synthase lyase subunit PdxS [candidate division Zixibacteria bacterium]
MQKGEVKHILPTGEEVIRSTNRVKRGFARMTKGGVIMDVTTVEQAHIAEEAGAVAVMVLDKLPIDVRRSGGVARPASIRIIEDILEAITIPVMAKCRIGHTYEALVLQESGADCLDESEVLTPADEWRHIWKWDFVTPFVCGALDLGSAIRRIDEGAAMIRTKGEPGTGNVAEAIRHLRIVNDEINEIKGFLEAGDYQQLMAKAREMKCSFETVLEVAKLGRLPVVNFAAGGISTPADAAQMMNLGADGIFVGSGIFKSEDPMQRASATVLATAYWDRPEVVYEAQEMVNEEKAMLGLTGTEMKFSMQERGADS